jgi:hypothetical protein
MRVNMTAEIWESTKVMCEENPPLYSSQSSSESPAKTILLSTTGLISGNTDFKLHIYT